MWLAFVLIIFTLKIYLVFICICLHVLYCQLISFFTGPDCFLEQGNGLVLEKWFPVTLTGAEYVH